MCSFLLPSAEEIGAGAIAVGIRVGLGEKCLGQWSLSRWGEGCPPHLYKAFIVKISPTQCQLYWWMKKKWDFPPCAEFGLEAIRTSWLTLWLLHRMLQPWLPKQVNGRESKLSETRYNFTSCFSVVVVLCPWFSGHGIRSLREIRFSFKNHWLSSSPTGCEHTNLFVTLTCRFSPI